MTLSSDDESADSEEVESEEEDEEPKSISNEEDVEEEEEVESAALKWAREQAELAQELEEMEQAEADDSQEEKTKKFVVVGAGWGGWGAAQALCEAGKGRYDVTIIDALPDPTGRTPYLSPTAKPVEAGTRGFWKDYPNINALCEQLGIAETDVFTDFTNSSFYSPDGLEATAPVFSNAVVPDNTLPFLSQLGGQALPPLPSPLGQVLATFPLFERIPLADRASMVGLLLATVDCFAGDEDVRAAYDRMSAHDLFVQFRLSDRLVQDFITPTLLVGLFKPPEELSALVVMELLYYYALAHTDSFDVRWIKNGTVADSLIRPLADCLEDDPFNLNILGGCRVGKISTTPSTTTDGGKHMVSSIEYTDSRSGSTKTIRDIDGIVLAVTARGMKAVVDKSPDLARYPTFTKAASCGAIDVISVRLWLDRTVATRTPANVFSRFEELRGAGGTFFMLDQLQSESQQDLWGKDETPQGSVVACDFYNAGALLSLPDEEIVDTLMKDLLPSAVPAFADAQTVDTWVGRYPGGVTWFAPGSYDKRPPLQGVDAIPNLKCAGDWVRLGPDLEDSSAKGLCQERAYASGLHAANALLKDCNLLSSGAAHSHNVLPVNVIPVREDEAQFRAAIQLNQQVMKFLPRFWVR